MVGWLVRWYVGTLVELVETNVPTYQLLLLGSEGADDFVKDWFFGCLLISGGDEGHDINFVVGDQRHHLAKDAVIDAHSSEIGGGATTDRRQVVDCCSLERVDLDFA